MWGCGKDLGGSVTTVYSLHVLGMFEATYPEQQPKNWQKKSRPCQKITQQTWNQFAFPVNQPTFQLPCLTQARKPTRLSKTEVFPTDCEPMTVIIGNERSECNPFARRKEDSIRALANAKSNTDNIGESGASWTS